MIPIVAKICSGENRDCFLPPLFPFHSFHLPCITSLSLSFFILTSPLLQQLKVSLIPGSGPSAKKTVSHLGISKSSIRELSLSDSFVLLPFIHFLRVGDGSKASEDEIRTGLVVSETNKRGKAERMRARESIERTLSSLPFFVTEEKAAKRNRERGGKRYMVKRKRYPFQIRLLL